MRRAGALVRACPLVGLLLCSASAQDGEPPAVLPTLAWRCWDSYHRPEECCEGPRGSLACFYPPSDHHFTRCCGVGEGHWRGELARVTKQVLIGGGACRGKRPDSAGPRCHASGTIAQDLPCHLACLQLGPKCEAVELPHCVLWLASTEKRCPVGGDFFPAFGEEGFGNPISQATLTVGIGDLGNRACYKRLPRETSVRLFPPHVRDAVAADISKSVFTNLRADSKVLGSKTGFDNFWQTLSSDQLRIFANISRGAVPKSRLEIVMAAADDEEIQWSNIYKNLRTVYCTERRSKAHDCVPAPQADNVDHVHGYAYLHHIVQNYDNLSDWTVFTRAAKPMVSKTEVARRSGHGHLLPGMFFHDYVMQGFEHRRADLNDDAFFVLTGALRLNTLEHFWRSSYLGNVLPEQRRRSTTTQPKAACPEMWEGDGWEQSEPISLLGDHIPERCGVAGSPLPRALSDYWEKLKLPRPWRDMVFYSQGSRFAASKARIRQRPKAFYEELLRGARAGGANSCETFFSELFWFYIVGRPQHAPCMVSELWSKRELRENLAWALFPVTARSDTLVVIPRCRQPLPWLGRLLNKLGSNSNVHAVIYERCEMSAEGRSLSTWPEVTIRDVPRRFSSNLVLIAHFMVHMSAYDANRFRRTAIVAVDAIAVDEDFDNMLEWRLDEFAGWLTSTASVFLTDASIHMVETSALGPQFMQKFQNVAKIQLTGRPPEAFAAPKGYNQCTHEESLPDTSTTGRNNAIVTYVSSLSFLVMARVLLYSLLKAGTKATLVVATLSKIFSSLSKTLAAEFPTVRVVVWDAITPPSGTQEQSRWRDNYSKLNLFKMTEFARILYVDADILPLSNPDAILDHKVVKSARSPLLSAPDWNKWHRPPSTKFNGGVLVIRPSQALFDCMLGSLSTTLLVLWNTGEAEQGFLRYFFGDQPNQLPYLWNMQKSLKWKIPELWDEEQAVLLHYVHTKPFRSWAPPMFYRRYRGEEERRKLQLQDLDDDELDDSFAIAVRWRREFFALANLSQYMRVFVLYHNKATFSLIGGAPQYDPELFEPMSLTIAQAGNNISVRHILPWLADPVEQLQLGETGGLMAMAKANWYNLPWIGFSTASEVRKSIWREGVAADWTQVETVLKSNADERSVMFWYGIFAGDYWRLMDKHHPGMKNVMFQILSRMGFHRGHVDMPKNKFWPFGNYVIMPTRLLREYVAFIDHFRDLYRAAYRSTCPFQTMEVHKKDFQRRCLGYVTERLLHIWAILRQVKLRYVVDDPHIRYVASCSAHWYLCKFDS